MNQNISAQIVVDTSALVAIVQREDEYLTIAEALVSVSCLLPAPMLVEFARVTAFKGNVIVADALIAKLIRDGASIFPFDAAAYQVARHANLIFGKGNGDGGLLNMLDLMVYGVAKITGLPILCTGNDFASTDAIIHPASRIG